MKSLKVLMIYLVSTMFNESGSKFCVRTMAVLTIFYLDVFCSYFIIRDQSDQQQSLLCPVKYPYYNPQNDFTTAKLRMYSKYPMEILSWILQRAMGKSNVLVARK